MDFLKNNRRFCFLYDKKQLEDCDFTVSSEQNGEELTTVYTFSDGLKVTNKARKINKFGAYEWVNWFENTGDKSTGIISDLWDASFSISLEHEEKLPLSAYIPEPGEITKIYNPKGSDCTEYEFCSRRDGVFWLNQGNYLKVGSTKKFGSSHGRSSDDRSAPFFNIHKSGKGFICAVGWTGQWHAEVERTCDEAVFRSGIPGLNFRLLPKEKIRTSSIVVMPYEANLIDSQNIWRRLVKEEYSLIGSEGREKYGPLCASVWGGMKTSSVLDRIEIIRKNKLPYEYLWMDAGWYGIDTPPTPDEFEGSIWSEVTGDWRISKVSHPDGLSDVSKAAHDAGLKFILWFEPERSKKNAVTALEHPEYFLGSEDERCDYLLLNLGREDAWNYIYNTISGLIEKLDIDFYRHDANFEPLYFWDRADSRGDRKGITQIKHIMGMYKLWDALLKRFPRLLIDNCASGGKRIDIETLRRSMPLWRSDYQCPANFDINGSLSHHLSFNSWLPYSGSGMGRAYDLYRARCSYDSSLTTNFSYSERDSFCDTEEKIGFVKKMCEEYIMLRPYFKEDFYPLTEITALPDVWTAAQFDRPSQGDGIVQVFRREGSPFTSASFSLFAIDGGAEYVFTDIDDNTEFVISGKELTENGFNVTLNKKRTAKVYLYKKR